MKNVLLLLFLLINSILYSQTELPPNRRPTLNDNTAKKALPAHLKKYDLSELSDMKSRYNKDYEIQDESLLGQDSIILESLNFRTIDAFREKDSDVTILYKGLDIYVEIYSREKADNNNATYSKPLNSN